MRKNLPSPDVQRGGALDLLPVETRLEAPKMPRKSAAELAITPAPTWSTRLRPPATLSPPASVEFVRIVTTEEAQHFRASDLPLLTQYCEAAALAERAARELQRDDAEACWLTRWDKATRVMAGLSMRLRISPQARAPHNPTRPQRGSVLSHYEVMALERPNNDAD
jgi:phage terminase small subunit